MICKHCKTATLDVQRKLSRFPTSTTANMTGFTALNSTAGQAQEKKRSLSISSDTEFPEDKRSKGAEGETTHDRWEGDEVIEPFEGMDVDQGESAKQTESSPEESTTKGISTEPENLDDLDEPISPETLPEKPAEAGSSSADAADDPSNDADETSEPPNDGNKKGGKGKKKAASNKKAPAAKKAMDTGNEETEEDEEKEFKKRQTALKGMYTKAHKKALQEKAAEEAKGRGNDPDPEHIPQNASLGMNDIIRAITAVTENVEWPQEPCVPSIHSAIYGCQSSIITAEHLLNAMRDQNLRKRALSDGHDAEAESDVEMQFPILSQTPKQVARSMPKLVLKPDDLKWDERPDQGSGFSENEATLIGDSPGRAARTRRNLYLPLPWVYRQKNGEDEAWELKLTHWILFVVEIPLCVWCKFDGTGKAIPTVNTAQLPQIKVCDPENMLLGTQQREVMNDVMAIVHDLQWYLGPNHGLYGASPHAFLPEDYPSLPALFYTEDLPLYKSQENRDQSAEASSAIHCVLNAWVDALHLKGTRSFELEKKRKPILEFYDKAVQLINLVIDGYAGSEMIYNFLCGYGYAIENESKTVAQSQRFDRNDKVHTDADVVRIYNHIIETEAMTTIVENDKDEDLDDDDLDDDADESDTKWTPEAEEGEHKLGPLKGQRSKSVPLTIRLKAR